MCFFPLKRSVEDALDEGNEIIIHIGIFLPKELIRRETKEESRIEFSITKREAAFVGDAMKRSTYKVFFTYNLTNFGDILFLYNQHTSIEYIFGRVIRAWGYDVEENYMSRK